MRPEAHPARRSIETLSGRIRFLEAGSGPPALFLHPALASACFWRHQLAGLSAERRCIAPDMLAHGETEIILAQPVTPLANARMLREFLDALQLYDVDLVGCGAGGVVALLFAALHPSRVRSLALVQTPSPDEAPAHGIPPLASLAVEGRLRSALEQMRAYPRIFRAETAFGEAYERPEAIPEAVIHAYLTPFLRTEQRTRDVERFLAAFSGVGDMCLCARLGRICAPTLVAWGDADPWLPPDQAERLAAALPGSPRRLAFAGARARFAEERPDALGAALAAHWRSTCGCIEAAA